MEVTSHSYSRVTRTMPDAFDVKRTSLGNRGKGLSGGEEGKKSYDLLDHFELDKLFCDESATC